MSYPKPQNISEAGLKKPELTRRNFLKTSTCFTLGSITVGSGFFSVLNKKGDIAIISETDDVIASAIPPKWAVGELKAALEARGSVVRVVSRMSETKANEFCIAACGMKNPLAQTIFNQKNITVSTEPESLCLVQGEIKGRQILIAAGTDPLGLVYSVTELTDRVQCIDGGLSELEFSQPVIERPASRTRSILRSFSSLVDDKVWFYDHDYWRSYLTMLVTSRINRLNLAMGMGYNSARRITDGYLVFPYPFFVSVPGYDVRVNGLNDEERNRNLTMLKFISEETTKRGLRFQIGIWTLAYSWADSPKASYSIEGLTDTTHAPYCRDALALILKEVPAISGVTFRVHSESGIPKGQESFWKTQFGAIAQCGRRVEIDMHAKNMEPETLQDALSTGQPVVISPKFSGEHLIPPYHQSAIRELEMVPENSVTDTGTGVLIGNRRFTRYGYADLLAENRNWDVVFRIWPGTQRFLLNGDPATFAGYGRIASFCGASGIELFEPLGFKGRQGSGLQGGRNAYSDTSLNPNYDFEKYLYTYRLWGRLGYNPDADPEVWRRLLKRNFGAAALAVENTIATASRILPLITLAHGPSADCLLYWPEMYTNMPIDTSRQQPYGDTQSPKLFGNASPFDRQLFMSPDECGDVLVAGHTTGKYSPLEVAQWLEGYASDVLTHLNTARTQLGQAASAPEFRRVEEDVLIQRGLALFFGAKLRSAVLWRIFSTTGNRAAGNAAIVRYTEGRNTWAAMAERAKNIYLPNITYGINTLSGHWLDRIPAFDEDIADMRKRIETNSIKLDDINPALIDKAINIANTKPKRPSVSAEHTPAERFGFASPVPVRISIRSTAPHRIVLYYRHVNQAERWQSVELTNKGDAFYGEIPANYTSTRYPLQYYFEIVTSPSEATLFPQLSTNFSNVPYYIIRLNRNLSINAVIDNNKVI